MKTKVITTIMITLFLASMISIAVSLVRASPTTYYVATTGSDVTGDGSSGNPWATISHAVSVASPGDTIIVAAGTYNEKVFIDKTLILWGAKHGVDARTRDASTGESVIQDPWGPVQISADNVVLDGFTIQGSTQGDPGTLAGIWGNPWWGGTHGGHQILNNIVQNNIMGLSLGNDGTYQTIIRFNLFQYNNNPGPASGNGIYTDWGLYNAIIDSNTFIGNSMLIIFASDLTISNNLMTDGGMGLLSTSTVSISGNKIQPSSDAIWLGGGNDGVTITSNTLQDATGHGILVDNEWGTGPNANIEVHYNKIQGNSLGGLIVDTGDYTEPPLDATYNWWGDPSGPYHPTLNPSGTGNAVSDYVNFDPWIEALQFQPSSSSIVLIGSTATLTVCLTDSSDVGVADMEVKISSSPTLTFTPVPPAPLTNSEGYATFTTTSGTAGIYTVTATFCGVISDTWTLVFYEPVGMTAGGGWYLTYGTDADTYGTTDGARATFGFTAKYVKGSVTPTGNLEFQYHTSDGINLKSTSIQWLQIGGNVAQFGGTAMVNGVSGYYFRVKAQDKGEPGTSDEFMIKIWLGDPNLDGTLIHASHSTLYGGNIIVRTK